MNMFLFSINLLAFYNKEKNLIKQKAPLIIKISRLTVQKIILHSLFPEK